MKIVIMDASGMETRVLSDFFSHQGFEVDFQDQSTGLPSAPGSQDAAPCVVILGMRGNRHHGLMQVQGAVDAYPGVPIVLLADRAFCVDASCPHLEAIQAVVRRPIQLQEVEWVLHRLCKIDQTGAIH